MGRVIKYIKAYGLSKFYVRVQEKLKDKKKISYKKWRKRNITSLTSLEKQSQEVFVFQPLFSIVIPLYKTPEKFLLKLIDSIECQTYSNW